MTSKKWEVLDTATVFGSKYYTVEPKWVDWGDRHNEWNGWLSWCQETFGGTGDLFNQQPLARWYANNSRLWFKNEKDVTMFLLKWS